MPLPKISHPTFPLLVPSLDRACRFRPFTVKEEKILLMARESADAKDHFRAIHQVVNNCAVGDFPIDDLATFDIDWLYLKLRAESVSKTVTQTFNDREDKTLWSVEGLTAPLPVYTFDINLDEVVAPQLPPGYKGGHVVYLDDDKLQGVELRYPPASLFLDEEYVENSGDAILYRSTRRIFDAAASYEVTDVTQAEVVEYYDGWNTRAMERVTEFLNSAPTMSYTIKYKNKQDHDRSVTLTGLTDFFTS